MITFKRNNYVYSHKLSHALSGADTLSQVKGVKRVGGVYIVELRG